MPSVNHVFVLMLENRSFDHMLGFSGISGTDASTGGHTILEGLIGNESNVLNGTTYTVTRGADYAMPADPGHEFLHVLDQLTGAARYAAPYPLINNGGFVASYAATTKSADLSHVMKCFDTPRQLPILYALGQEFAVCDHWFASMPGPTWPNRMFAHAASSGGLDHSPSTMEIVAWETLDGFAFEQGTVFDLLKKGNRRYHLYSGDEFPMVAALKGVTLSDVDRIDKLVRDLAPGAAPFPYDYVFIEPSYNALQDYKNSSSQHPLADVRDGERLIKTVYEALRASPIWESSLLIITWDEHGGFYDHVSPPITAAPGDTLPKTNHNQYGFTFEQYGVRVPALVISPLIPRNTIDHRVYDHASIPATLEDLFNLPAMTRRDVGARDVLSLLTLAAPRDAVTTLPPATSPPVLAARAVTDALDAIGADPDPVTRPDDPINGGMFPTIIHSAMRQDLELNPGNKQDILKRIAGLNTRADAMEYLRDVQMRLRNAGAR